MSVLYSLACRCSIESPKDLEMNFEFLESTRIKEMLTIDLLY